MLLIATNGGPHPPEKWAAVSAASIIQISEGAIGKNLAEGRDLEKKIVAILERQHKDVQEHERAQIKSFAGSRLMHPLDLGDHRLEQKVAEIVAAAKGSLFEYHFHKVEVQKHLYQVLGRDFASVMDIERSWYADRLLVTDDQHSVAKRYHELRSRVGAANVHLYA
jgi:hypothetical protein